MAKIIIATVHKSKEAWLDSGCKDYIQRLSPKHPVEIILYKDEDRLAKAISEDKRPLLLDPKGKQLDSPAFALMLEKEIEIRGNDAFFAIGGPEGFPSSLKAGKALISLSTMTFTHQLARLLLLEQIYRAFEILRGSPYHK